MAGNQDETKPNDPPPTETPPGDAALPAPATTTTTPPAPPPASGEGSGDGKVVQVQHSDFKKIKDEAREKGRREALGELDAMADKLGFSNLEGALKALADLKKTPPEPKTTEPKPTETTTMATTPTKKKTVDERSAEKQQREAQRQADQASKFRKDWRSSQKQIRQLKLENDVLQAKNAMTIKFARAGVDDVDYVLRLYARANEGRSEEEISKFDVDAWLTKLRTDKPVLFKETLVPATTGTNGAKPDGSNPTAPASSETVKQTAASQQFDARKASREEYEAHLKKLGLNPAM